ncbi:MAG: CDGSH-type Zn-finger protein [Rickettsiales bacterium]|jgi:CDGSH-type Zn-finger protein
MTKDLPNIVQKAPFKVLVDAGKSYYYCSCGLSESQPFCDGSHKGTGLKSISFKSEESKTIYFCGCKHSAKGALCDGSHNKI